MTKGTGEERAIIIGFPQLYPDELLYSGCARFSDYRRYPNRRHVPEELFGNPHQSAIIDLPIRLTYLVEHLPPEHGYTVEQLITHHTFYPFYAPFLQPEQRKRLYEDMCGNHGRGIQLRAGISSRGIASPASLRFCPVCVEADRERYGEAYWHRSHQLPSILVCAHHGVFLEDSHISTRANHGADSYTFFSAERHVRPACPRVLDTTQHEQNVLFALAKDAVWVLTHPGMSFEPDCYLPRYHLLLQEHGYITIRDFVWISKLVDEFIAYYTREVLERLQCQPANTGKIPTDYWLRRLMRKHNGETFHPVQHLLLIQFVGHSVQRFLETPAQPQFFGTGPWPCLNRFCNHYQQEVITECVIQPRLTGGKVEGIFECSCGFVYARTQHSNARQSTLGYSRVVSYGDVWKAGFTHLWNDPQISVKSIAHTIHIAKRSVVQFAAFLNLSFEHRQIKPPKHVTFFEQLVSRQYRRDRNRQLITDTLNAHPDITRTELRVRHSHAMQWLQRYDPDWLNG
jgi:hypothetical protein